MISEFKKITKQASRFWIAYLFIFVAIFLENVIKPLVVHLDSMSCRALYISFNIMYEFRHITNAFLSILNWLLWMVWERCLCSFIFNICNWSAFLEVYLKLLFTLFSFCQDHLSTYLGVLSLIYWSACCWFFPNDTLSWRL